MKRFTSLHPLAIGAFPVLSLYSANTGEAPFANVVRSLVIALAAALLVWLAAWICIRHRRRAALVASIAIAGFWCFQFVLAALLLFFDAVSDVLWFVAMVAWFVLVSIAIGWVVRDRGEFRAATRTLDAIGASLIVVCLVTAAPTFLAGEPRAKTGESGGAGPSAKEMKEWLEEREEVRRGLAVELDEAPARRPDIYLFVLDGFGRGDLLAEHFGMEERLEAALRQRGFYVARESTSNYNQTVLSMPSMLNFQYLDAILTGHGIKYSQQRTCENAVVSSLVGIGYEFISCASGYFITECYRADRYIDPVRGWNLLGWIPLGLNGFERALMNKTPMEQWLRKTKDLSPYTKHRKRIFGCLDALPEYSQNDSSEFVFVHIIAPHEPFVFGRNGEDVSDYDLPYDVARIFDDPDLPEEPGRVGPEYARRYRDEALFIGDRIVEEIDGILARSKQPPIIIVMGDHGPYGFSPDVRDARFEILNAYHLPHGVQQHLYPEITPVNSFRLILSRYFGADLELLPDERYRRVDFEWRRAE